MKIKYFKNYTNMGDCYVGEKNENPKKFDYFNIICISKDYFFLFANDESSNFLDGRFDGFYRLMDVSKKDFLELKKAIIDKDRIKGINLIKKFHNNNPDKNPNLGSIEGSIENFSYEKTFEIYKKSKPILE